MSEELRTPTETLFVTAVLVGGERLRGAIHVTPESDEAGPTALFHLLNGAGRFVPLTPTSNSSRDRTLFLQLSQLLAIEMDCPPEQDPPLDEVLPCTLSLPSEVRYPGAILASLPAGQTRLSDALNHVDRFVRMRVGPRAIFVNAAHIIHAVERDATG